MRYAAPLLRVGAVVALSWAAACSVNSTATNALSGTNGPLDQTTWTASGLHLTPSPGVVTDVSASSEWGTIVLPSPLAPTINPLGFWLDGLDLVLAVDLRGPKIVTYVIQRYLPDYGAKAPSTAATAAIGATSATAATSAAAATAPASVAPAAFVSNEPPIQVNSDNPAADYQVRIQKTRFYPGSYVVTVFGDTDPAPLASRTFTVD